MRLINVAATRAKSKLIVIANVDYINKKGDFVSMDSVFKDAKACLFECDFGVEVFDIRIS